MSKEDSGVEVTLAKRTVVSQGSVRPGSLLEVFATLFPKAPLLSERLKTAHSVPSPCSGGPKAPSFHLSGSGSLAVSYGSQLWLIQTKGIHWKAKGHS